MQINRYEKIDLVRIGNQTRNTFRCTGAPEHPKPLCHTALPFRARRDLLKVFIKRPLYRPLRNAKIASRQALIESADALLPEYLPDDWDAPRRKAAHIGAGAFRSLSRELHARFDDPNRIRSGASDDAGESSGREVHEGVFAAIVEGVRDDLLAVAVREEVDRTRGDDSDESRPESFEECAGRLEVVNIAEGP